MNALSSESLPALKLLPQKPLNNLSPATLNTIIQQICNQCDLEEIKDNSAELGGCHLSVHCRFVNYNSDGSTCCVKCKNKC